RTISRARWVGNPPTTGVPVPGAQEGSRQSMSKVKYALPLPTIFLISERVVSGGSRSTLRASRTVKPCVSSLWVRMPICTERRGSTSPSWTAWKNIDRKSTRLNSSHDQISYAVFCLKKKKKKKKKENR